jgi:intein/homing endonuclease
MVNTADGFMAIEELEVGDFVLGMDDRNQLVPCEVTETYKSVGCNYYVINDEIQVTGTHPFFINGEWVEASNLKVGDQLINNTLEPIVIESVDIVNKAVRAYNIEVSNTHTFFAQGVLVHNKVTPGKQ